MNIKGHLFLIPVIAILSCVLLLDSRHNLSSKSSNPNTILNNSISSQNTRQAPSPRKMTLLANSQINTTKLEKYLTVEAALLGVSDNISVYFKDLNSNAEVSIDPTRSWIPASTIKAYVVLEAFRQRDLGLINLDRSVTVKAQNVVPTELETDEFPRLREGTTATIRQLVEAMVIQSDNTAYNTLLDILDRRNINDTLRSLGITETVVGEKLNLDDNQFQVDLAVPGRQPNTTTAKDLATLFDLLFNHKVADADEMLSIFKRQKINTMIPVLLPPDTPVAHKTGDWTPIYHDGGVIYKPYFPFILTIFTNSGDQSVISKLAKIAYSRTLDDVGSSNQPPNQQAYLTTRSNSPVYALKPSALNTSVLGAEIPDKFPVITAADLGITSRDLNLTPEQINGIQTAHIYPGSFIYSIKRFIENILLNLPGNNETKVGRYLSFSKSRLSEIKALLIQGRTQEFDSLLRQSNTNLIKAVNLAQSDPQRDRLLSEIKYVNDLHYAVLNQMSVNLPTSQKDSFVDSVYNFYQTDRSQVLPVVDSSVIANPTQQKPAIGIITKVNGNTAVVKFDDLTEKQLILTDVTRVRAYADSFYQSINNLKPGDKIAVMGTPGSKTAIIPQFILRNVPKELPNVHKGTIININPNENTLKILNQQGVEEVIKIDNLTSLHSRDTNISLAGIKVGSQVAVFGVLQNASPNFSPYQTNGPAASSSLLRQTSAPFIDTSPYSALPFGQNTPEISPPGSPAAPLKKSEGNKAVGSPSPKIISHSNAPNIFKPQGSSIELHATSVTIIVNDPGKNEIVSSPARKDMSHAKPTPPPKKAKH